MAIHDVIILGAGVAGLQCARRLKEAGSDVLVVDRADKPGGRCATRIFEGQPADYGPAFIHGHEPGFLSAVDAVDAERVAGWPARVSGHGKPCQPVAFAPYETRLAFVEGVNAFPRSLAKGLEIRLAAQASAIEVNGDTCIVALRNGERLAARELVLALALEQTIPFLRMFPAADGAAALGMLSLFTSLPCLALVAGYDAGTTLPDWEILYPEEEPALLLVSNESSKRPAGGGRVMLLQAAPRWSRQNLERPAAEWSAELLGIAARRLGAWAAAPRWTHPHRWRYGRLDLANELTGPLIVRAGARRIGIAGDLLSPGGGLQAAWMSGDRLAQRLLSARD
jgi:predicted NAD/FAD-dependent oxidoreductase